MELVRGPTLAEQLREGPLPFANVVGLAIQLAEALRACLSFDIVHGDIKPSNVLTTESGSVKLSDFGLATRLSASATNAEGISGTPDYLAPEDCSEVWPGWSISRWQALFNDYWGFRCWPGNRRVFTRHGYWSLRWRPDSCPWCRW
jgi:serine/threonine protein kinase